MNVYLVRKREELNIFLGSGSAFFILYYNFHSFLAVLKKILNLCETHFNTNETNETTKNPLVPVRLIPGDGQLTLLPGELLKIHTASNSKGRVLYRMLIRHFHGEENIVRGVPVETQMEQKLIGKDVDLS